MQKKPFTSAQCTGYERGRDKAQGTGMRYGQNLDTRPLQDYRVFTKGKIETPTAKRCELVRSWIKGNCQILNAVLQPLLYNTRRSPWVSKVYICTPKGKPTAPRWVFTNHRQKLLQFNLPVGRWCWIASQEWTKFSANSRHASDVSFRAIPGFNHQQ